MALWEAREAVEIRGKGESGERGDQPGGRLRQHRSRKPLSGREFSATEPDDDGVLLGR